MAGKLSIIDTLGEASLLLPARVNAALAANDRAKFRFALLQTARQAADRPGAPTPPLRTERIASGVTDETLDGVIAGATQLDGDRYRIAHASRVVAELLSDVRTMVAALRETVDGSALAKRLVALEPMVVATNDDEIAGACIDRMTSGDRAAGDSLHLVVMDAHKCLNRMQATLASEHIDGASAYDVRPADRERIHAFMRGVNRTAPLKFDHPGLATTATRSGERLVLQNDIGTTDAHVLVVNVEAPVVTVTYTDFHLPRLLFFESMFEPFHVEWEDARSRHDASFEDGVFHLGVGRYRAADTADLDRFVEFLGSRLVFLIDWNKARKRLRNFVPNGEAIRLLRWAADENLGHMAFLQAGGERLVFDAIEFATKGQFPVGGSLHETLGAANTREFLRSVLRSASELLLRGEAETHVQDVVKAELTGYFRSRRQDLFDIAVEHASFVHEIAGGVRDGMLARHAGESAAASEQRAQRAKAWESRADECVNRAREALRNAESGEFFRTLLEDADDVADELEEAAFHLTLLQQTGGTELLPPLEHLAGLLVQGAQEYVKALEIARDVRRGGAREDMQDFLDAIHRLTALEKRSDEAERSVEAKAAAASDFRVLHFVTEAARNLEQAADALMHCGLRLRDNVLGEVLRA